MFKKTLVAALVVASAALAVTAKAAPQPAPFTAEPYYMERASQNHDNGGN